MPATWVLCSVGVLMRHVLRQGLSKLPRLASNSSCLRLWSSPAERLFWAQPRDLHSGLFTSVLLEQRRTQGRNVGLAWPFSPGLGGPRLYVLRQGCAGNPRLPPHLQKPAFSPLGRADVVWSWPSAISLSSPEACRRGSSRCGSSGRRDAPPLHSSSFPSAFHSPFAA